jgi:hypothetical protein
MTSDSQRDKSIAILETNYAFMIQQLNEIKDGIHSIQKDIKCIKDESVKNLEEHIKESDRRYASKRVEVMVDRLIWVVVVSVLTGLLALVLKM